MNVFRFFAGACLVATIVGHATAEQPYAMVFSKSLESSPSSDLAASINLDLHGNILIAGTTTGNLAGQNQGVGDGFVVKYDSSGNLQLGSQIGTAFTDDAYAVASDQQGNFFVGGDTGGNLGAAGAGFTDAFIRKYDSSGNILWTRQFGTVDGDQVNSIATDSTGNTYFTGGTFGPLVHTGAGGEDVIVYKLDSGGNVQWSRQLGTAAGEVGQSIALDKFGNSYVTGQTGGSLAGSNLGSADAFLIKHDLSGNLLWSKQIGTSASDSVAGVAVDTAANVYLVGTTEGNFAKASAGGSDVFLAKYDGSGNLVWSQQLGTSGTETAAAIALDPVGNVFICGNTTGDLAAVNAGIKEYFLAKYDSSGNLLWTEQFGTSSLYDQAFSLASDGAGDIFLTGTHANRASGEGTPFFAEFSPVPEPCSFVLAAVSPLAAILIMRPNRRYGSYPKFGESQRSTSASGIRLRRA